MKKVLFLNVCICLVLCAVQVFVKNLSERVVGFIEVVISKTFIESVRIQSLSACIITLVNSLLGCTDRGVCHVCMLQ